MDVSAPARTVPAACVVESADAGNRLGEQESRGGVLELDAEVRGLVYRVETPGSRVLDLYLGGRRVWSFTESDRDVPDDLRPAGATPAGVLRFQPWPDALLPWLSGRATVGLGELGRGTVAEVLVDFGGKSGELRLADRYGRPLVVNKWGRLGRALADAPAGFVDRMLDSMDGIREVLERELGQTVYVTGGTLLGPVREGGRLIAHDDDADLAYLSEHEHPADVALENFRLGRALRTAGYDVLRLSVGHLQVVVDHEGVPDHYVDVFTGFLMDGRWHQHFPIRTAARREDLLPPSTVVVEGRPEPAPRRPEFMLEQLFGSGWQTPDPSFTFDIPAQTGDRFYGWFADYNVDREPWEDVVLLDSGNGTAARGISAFARSVVADTPADSGILELGCGLGSDALAMARTGRAVRAVDFSRHALRLARQQAEGVDADVTFHVVNLLDPRAVIRLGAEMAAPPTSSWTVFGRRLLNALEDRGRHNVYRLCSMLLRRGTAAHFDIVVDHSYPGIASHRHLTVQQVVAEAHRYDLELDEAVSRMEPMTWFDAPSEQLVETCRMTFRRRNR